MVPLKGMAQGSTQSRELTESQTQDDEDVVSKATGGLRNRGTLREALNLGLAYRLPRLDRGACDWRRL